jgi:hypothetical protein
LSSYLLFNTKNKNILNSLDKLKPNKALKIYLNFYIDRKELYKEFKGDRKGYVYMIVNKLNGKCYVGSTKSIKVRLSNYFNLAHLDAQKGRPISSALLKYGLVNFAFIIIEEVNLDVQNLEERETFWIRQIKLYPTGHGSYSQLIYFKYIWIQIIIIILLIYPWIVSGIYGLFSQMEWCDSYLDAYALFGLFPRIFTIKSLGFILTYDANRSVYHRGLQVGQDAHYSNIPSSKLHPMWITGFVDGEGSFYIKITPSLTHKAGWSVQACFSIGLHKKDQALLELIRLSLGSVGKIYSTNNTAQYEVRSIKELTEVIIPHFNKYPLITQKKADYELFKQAVNLMNMKEHTTLEGIQQIVNIKVSMNRMDLSNKLRNTFSDIRSVPRISITLPESLDLNWFAGFASGESCFFVEILKRATKSESFGVRLKFQITQHERDQGLLRELVNQLGCGRYEGVKEHNHGKFVVTKLSDLESKILPLFIDYPIHGVKALDLADFRKVVEIVKIKGHLTQVGLEEIRKIKAGMRQEKIFTS